MDQESDGQPRFNAPSTVDWTGTIGFINDTNFPDFMTYMLVTTSEIWEGSITLAAAAASLSALATLAF